MKREPFITHYNYNNQISIFAEKLTTKMTKNYGVINSDNIKLYTPTNTKENKKPRFYVLQS